MSQTALIPLTKGKYAIVDAEDFEWLSKHKWHCNNSYATRQDRSSRNRVNVKMARLLMGCSCGDGNEVDHINHNTLDNRRCNLRICTTQQNQHNRKSYVGGSSPFKGVSFSKDGKRKRRWRAGIEIDGSKKRLGYYATELEAAEAYNEAAKKYFGEFAYLNEI